MRAGTKTTRDWLIGVAVGVGAVTAVTVAIELIDDVVPVLSLGVLYVFAVLLVAIFWGPLVAVPVAVASMLAFNFFFLPPLYTFTLADRSNWLALAVYVVVAIVVGSLASRYRTRGADAEQRERESALLADIAADLLRGVPLDESIEQIEKRTAAVLGVSSVRIALGEHPRARVPRVAPPAHGRGRVRSASSTRPRTRSPRSATQRRLLPALASLLGVTLEREALAREAVEAETLRRSDTVKTAVIQAVSHDLRTPLATIEQALDGLESDELALSDDDRRALLETIRAEHRRLKRLVENLLDLSRLQARAAEARPELWTVDELVAQALDDLPGAERVVVTAPDELPPVRVDATQIQRALANVLENALRLSPAGETVSVRLTATRKDVLIRVTDRGPGVPEAERERIFEPFHRVAGRSDEPGAGLGLAIARGFTEANGGRMWLESREGQGASFVIALPLVELPAASPRDPRILVVDDEPQFLRALQTNLRGAGYDVVTASTAEEALSSAGLQPPEAIILDLLLPDGRGTDVCRELRTVDRRADHPRLGRGRRGGEDRGARRRRRRLRDEAVRDRRASCSPPRGAAPRRPDDGADARRSASSSSTSRSTR